MTAKTVSKTDSKYNVKLIAITAMCVRLLLPLQLLLSRFRHRLDTLMQATL